MKSRGFKREKIKNLIKLWGKTVNSDSGFALPVALIVLIVITFLGISAITFTNLGIDVSRNIRNSEYSFYTADDCLNLGRSVLMEAHGVFDALLAGTGTNNEEKLTSTDYIAETGAVLRNYGDPVRQKRGVYLVDHNNTQIVNRSFGNTYCTVWIRNNEEDLKAGNLAHDTDATVVLTAEGRTSSTQGSKNVVVAAIHFYDLDTTTTAWEKREIEDYPQLTMGPQNINSAEMDKALDVLK